MQGAHGLEHLGFLIVDGAIALISRRLHGEQGDNLKQVVLDDVAQATGALVKRTATLRAKVLGQRDLHAGHMVAVPDWLEERVGETKVEDIHDRFLAEVVVDAEDCIFRERRQRNAVELTGRSQAASERFLDDDARLIGEPRGTEAFDHRGEQCGWDGQVMRRAPGITQRVLERLERIWVVVITAHILEQRKKVVEGVPACVMLSIARLRSSSGLHFGAATPTTGTLRTPRLAIA